MLSKKDKALLKAAKETTEKLNTYGAGVKAAGGRDATKKYNELNSKADKAVRALPVHLRSRFVVENFG